MYTVRLVTILFAFILFSCREEDKGFKIFPLKPNRISINSDTLNGSGWYSKWRNDFFVIKNYDANNPKHKIKIDSFVLHQIEMDSFLIVNKNSKWALTFFKYGNGIDENTVHEYETDYTIHNLFSYKKEIGSFFFNNRFGYNGSNYRITSEKTDNNKRKIISSYFDSIATLNPNLDYMMKITKKHLGYNDEPTIKTDTIKIVAKLIQKEVKDEVTMAKYRVLKTIQKNIETKGDTINVLYSKSFKPENQSINNNIVLVRYKLKFNSKYHYRFINDTIVSMTISAE